MTHRSAASQLAQPTEAARPDTRGALDQTSPVGLFRTDAEGCFIDVNPRWRELAGLTTAEALGTGWVRALHPDDRDRVAAAWERAVAGGLAFAEEHRFVHADGAVVWVIGQAVPERDAAGVVGGYAGAVMDISAGKRALEDLRAGEARFRALAAATASAIWTIDATGELVDAATARWPLLTDLPPADLADEWLAAVHPDDRAPGDAVWRAAVAAGRPFEFEQRVRQRDGSWRCFAVRGAPVRNADGAVVEWIGADIDVTDRRRAVEAARAAARRDAFRATLADAVRHLADPDEIQATASRLLGEHLRADRAFYAEAESGADRALLVVRRDYRADDGVPSIAGRHRLADFGAAVEAAVRSGGTFAVADAEAVPGLSAAERTSFAAIGVRAHATASLVKAGRLVALLGLHQAAPRTWTTDEVALLEETAERTWAAVERARAEATLRASEERLQLALSGARAGAWEWDLRTGRVAWSPELYDLVGIPRGSIDPSDGAFEDIIHPADREHVGAEFAAAAARGGPFEFAFRFMTADGEERWVASIGRVLHDEAGTPTLAVGINQDITARRLAEEQREDARRAMRLALEIADAGWFAWDLPADRVVGDETLARLFGLPAADVESGALPAAHFFRGMHPEDRARVEARLAGAAVVGGDYAVEYRVVGAEGTARWLASRGRVDLGPDGTATRLTGLAFDVTAQKEAERDAAFFADLGERIRVGGDADGLLASVAQLVSERFGAARCSFADIDVAGDRWRVRQEHRAEGVAPVTGDQPLSAYPAALVADLRAGSTVAVVDAAADPRTAPVYGRAYRPLGVRSFAIAPLLRDGALVGACAVTADLPMAWTVSDMALLETGAARAWAAVEQLRLDAEVGDRERRLALLANAMPQVVWVADADGTVRYYNDRVAAFAGVHRTASGAWEWQPMLHPDDLAPTLAAWERASRARAPYAHEHRIRMADGSERWHLSRAVPVLAADGSVEAWYGTATDIHEIKEAEQELERRRREFETLVEHAPDVVARFDRDLRFRYVNRAVEAMTGFPAEGRLGRALDDLGMPPQVAALWSARIREAFAAGEEQHAEFAYPTPAGERFFRTRVVPEIGDDGTIETVVAVTYDVTERVHAERDREGLLDTLAHDLKNPLAAIKGQAQLLRRQVERRGVPDAADLTDRARRFEHLTNRVIDLVEELSDHARVAAGHAVELRPERTDLVALVAESVEEIRQSAAGHDIALVVDAEPLVGDWDPRRLRRVVANLLGNAVKYSLGGGRIVVRLGRDGGQAVLRVTDEGIGIPATDLPFVFGFRRRAGNVGAIAGSGLGLAGARLIVEQHGGAIGVESEEGRGATFTVRLPLAPAGGTSPAN